MSNLKSLYIVLLTGISSFFLLSSVFAQTVQFEQSNRSRDLVQSGQESTLKTYGTFMHGIASGDPTPSSLIIWTRVTPDTYGDDVEVQYRVKDGPGIGADIVASGSITASDDSDYTVKLDVTGLESNTYYYYYFFTLQGATPLGRGKTAGLAADADQHLRFGIVSCSNYQGGYFNAYEKLAQRADLDAVIHLGDYFYEYAEGGYGYDSLLMDRGHDPDHEILTLLDYRTRYSFYRLDEDLQEIHRQHSFITIWDDHEIANDGYKDGAENHDDSTEGPWEDRVAAAKQAYFEWMPIRDESTQKIYRTLDYGNLTELIMIDTRFHGRELQVDSITDPLFNDPDRTMLGQDQLNWFQDELTNSTAQWKVVGNQVIFAQLLLAPLDPLFPGAVNQFLDIWDGYPAERLKIIDHVEDNDIDNIVMITGDFHSTMGWDITQNPEDSLEYDEVTGMGSKLVEFTVPSVTSWNFDENLDLATAAQLETILPGLHPHMEVVDLIEHGYMVLDIKPDTVQNDWYFMESIKTQETEEYFFSGAYSLDGMNTLNETNSPASGKSNPAPLAGDIEVGIEDLQNPIVKVVGLYPNPATELIWLNYALNEMSDLDIAFLDIQGKVISFESYKNQAPGLYDMKMLLSDVVTGEYLVQIKTESEVIALPVVIH